MTKIKQRKGSHQVADPAVTRCMKELHPSVRSEEGMADVALDGNRCEVCHGDDPAYRIERHGGPPAWICHECLPGWAASLCGRDARPATRAGEARMSEETTAVLQGELAQLREMIGNHHRLLGELRRDIDEARQNKA